MDKLEKKKLINQYKLNQKQKFEESLPMEKSLFLELFDYLDEHLSEEDCSQEFTLTIQFLKNKNVDIEKVLEFLKENGGYCDCEVLDNVEEKFGD